MPHPESRPFTTTSSTLYTRSDFLVAQPEVLIQGRPSTVMAAQPLSDAELLVLAKTGDEKSVEALLERYAPTLFRFATKMCSNQDDASDVVQETLIAAARGLRDFRGESSLSTWFFTVARSFCIKKRRTSKFAPTSTLSLDQDSAAAAETSPGDSPEQSAERTELADRLRTVIDSLDETNREVLLLRDAEGLTAPEVATVLGLSVEAVKSRLHRARAEVRTKMEAYLPGAPVTAGTPVTEASPSCPEIVSVFSRYLEGEITPVECSEMERHVEHCVRCKGACNSLRQTLALCKSTPRGEVPSEVQAMVKRAIRGVVDALPS
ncbi:MAG: sigma-70 family RNA polymerase sigma factor [Polyangiaceae bacterium]